MTRAIVATAFVCRARVDADDRIERHPRRQSAEMSLDLEQDRDAPVDAFACAAAGACWSGAPRWSSSAACVRGSLSCATSTTEVDPGKQRAAAGGQELRLDESGDQPGAPQEQQGAADRRRHAALYAASDAGVRVASGTGRLSGGQGRDRGGDAARRSRCRLADPAAHSDACRT